MRRLLLVMALLAPLLSGCRVSHSGSQEIEIAPWGWRPADEESNRILREATGDPRWGNVY